MSVVSSLEAGEGPIESQVRHLVEGVLGRRCSTRMTTRSPVGEGGVQVSFEQDANGLVEELADQAWVEAAASRSRRIYLRIETGFIRTWVAAGYAQSGDSDWPSTKAATEPCESLTRFRRLAVVTALSRIARSGTRGHESPAIGAVNVRYGPLRMRYGGTVGVNDAESELASAVSGLSGGAVGAALSLLLLATARPKHVHLDAEWFHSGASLLDDLLESLRTTGGDLTTQGTENKRAVRKLAFELNGLPRQTGLANSKLEPAYLARFGLGTATTAREARLEPADPLRRAVEVALKSTLGLLGTEMHNAP